MGDDHRGKTGAREIALAMSRWLPMVRFFCAGLSHWAETFQTGVSHRFVCIWLDWMAQGTRHSANFLHVNSAGDLILEMDHSPILVDDTLLLSPLSLKSRSQGCAFAHNFFADKIETKSKDGRQTPFLQPHATALAGLTNNPCGDGGFIINIFAGKADLVAYDQAALPVQMTGDVFPNPARPSAAETIPEVQTNLVLRPKILQRGASWFWAANLDFAAAGDISRPLVTTALLGRTAISQMEFESAGHSGVTVARDNLGNPWPEIKFPDGPLASLNKTTTGWQVWPN